MHITSRTSTPLLIDRRSLLAAVFGWSGAAALGAAPGNCFSGRRRVASPKLPNRSPERPQDPLVDIHVHLFGVGTGGYRLPNVEGNHRGAEFSGDAVPFSRGDFWVAGEDARPRL